MANIELINLVTTDLIQQKKIVEYNLRKETNSLEGDPTRTMELLREYRDLIGDIRLWESLLEEITNIPDEEKKEGDDNN
jgi:hypothetical protein